MGKYSNHSPVRDPFSQTVSIVQAQRTLQVHQGTYGSFTETISRNYLVKSLTHCFHGIQKIENTQDINRIKKFFQMILQAEHCLSARCLIAVDSLKYPNAIMKRRSNHVYLHLFKRHQFVIKQIKSDFINLPISDTNDVMNWGNYILVNFV